MHFRRVALAATVALVFAAQCRVAPTVSSAPSPPTVGGHPSVVPARFRVTVFASNLNFPYGMAVLSDGSILVGAGSASATDYYTSSGTLVRFEDLDHDGVADSTSGKILYPSLPGPLTSVVRVGSLIVVATGGETARLTLLRTGLTPADALTFVGAMKFSFPAPWLHMAYGLATRPTLGESGHFDLFFNVGSESDAAPSTGAVGIALDGLTGLPAHSLAPESIWMVTIDDRGSTPQLSNLVQVARGLRNAAGIAVDPASGDLYLADNGIDGPGPDPTSVDELNRIDAADIGGAVEDFGFPTGYTEYRSGTPRGAGGVAPLATFQPVPPPSGSKSEGSAQIAIAPAGFPAGVNDGVFVGFHGKIVLGGEANEENPLVFYDRRSGQHIHFIGNAEPDIGHMDGLLSTSDSLFVADMSSTGDIDGDGLGKGVVYQIAAIAPAA